MQTSAFYGDITGPTLLHKSASLDKLLPFSTMVYAEYNKKNVAVHKYFWKFYFIFTLFFTSATN